MLKQKIQDFTGFISKIKLENISQILDFLDWFKEKMNIEFKKNLPKIKFKKGDIYFVNLGKNIGSELNKTRPCIIYSIKSYNNINGVVVIPLKSFKNKKIIEKFQILIKKDKLNNFKKNSVVDIFYIKNVSTKRINKYIGKIDKEILAILDEKIIKMFGIKK